MFYLLQDNSFIGFATCKVHWRPPMIPYFSAKNIQIMTKLKSKRFFESVKIMFDITEVDDMKKLVEGIKSNRHFNEGNVGRSTYFHAGYGIIDSTELLSINWMI
ncbi:hypothetical protein ACQKND_22455 [Viridibacillus arvi]|uniref:hypothetical protein n=1 Tax=Viridibacillus arvi TaxID=263475 RepID=UPI003D06D011